MSSYDEMIKMRLRQGVVTRQIKDLPELEIAGLELKGLIKHVFQRSFNIREVDTGSCGACESEIIATINPIYDLPRFGINFVASPRHADALLVTGPVSKNMRLALRKAYEAMPDPKLVIMVGQCALDGGLFKGSYYIEGGVAAIVPVNAHIPGCPPSPLVIVQHLLALLKAL